MIFAITPQSCVILPHMGLSFARIGRTKEKDVSTPHQGIILDFDEQGFVKSVIVMPSSNCKTQEGIGIGSTREDVIKTFGTGSEEHLHLRKGSDAVGRIGDLTLRYRGISFTFSHGRVSMIALPPL